jgi:hypothetical protein
MGSTIEHKQTKQNRGEMYMTDKIIKKIDIDIDIDIKKLEYIHLIRIIILHI